MTNGQEDPSPALNFHSSMLHNINWIKQLAAELDISQGLASQAALMTMTMMDHHAIGIRLTQLQTDIDTLKASLCQSSS